MRLEYDKINFLRLEADSNGKEQKRVTVYTDIALIDANNNTNKFKLNIGDIHFDLILEKSSYYRIFGEESDFKEYKRPDGVSKKEITFRYSKKETYFKVMYKTFTFVFIINGHTLTVNVDADFDKFSEKRESEEKEVCPNCQREYIEIKEF